MIRRSFVLIVLGLAAGALHAQVGGNPPLATFTLENTSPNASSGFFRVGLAFEKGRVPNLTYLAARIHNGPTIRSGYFETNTWSDLSLRKCTFVGELPAPLPGLASVTIDVIDTATAPSASPFAPWNYLANNSDFKVEVDLKDCTSGAYGSTLTYSLNQHAATTTRREVQGHTSVCTRVYAWGVTPGEDHLVALHYVDLWRDASGTVVGIEYTPVMSQHWWVDDPITPGVSQVKTNRCYDARIKNGVTTIASYSDLKHFYYCRWAGLRSNNDDQHARRFWIDQGSAMPTLNVRYEPQTTQGMMKAGYLPPLKQGVAYNLGGYTSTYVPLGDLTGSSTMNHRRNIGATGGYNGRGFIPNMDAIATVVQSAQARRIARVSAQCGLAAHFHVRDHRLANFGSGGLDISNGIIPNKVNDLGPQTYPLLGAETYAVRGNSPPGIPEDAYHGPFAGAFHNWDPGHHVGYSYATAFVEGERYLFDAVLSAAEFVSHAQHYDDYGRNTPRKWYTHQGRRNAMSIPSGKYGSLHINHNQTRSLAFTQHTMTHAWALTPDGERHQLLLEKMQENASNWFHETMFHNGGDLFPASQLAFGTFQHEARMRGMSWQVAFTPLVHFQAAIFGNDKGWSGFQDVADISELYVANLWNDSPYSTPAYSTIFTKDTDGVFATDDYVLDYLPPDASYPGYEVFDFSSSTLEGDFSAYKIYPSSGDPVMIPTSLYIGSSPNLYPAGLAASTVYYLVNVVAVTTHKYRFQLATSPGGAPVSWTYGGGQVFDLGMDMVDAATRTPVGSNGAYMPSDDSYMPILHAALELGYGVHSPRVSDALYNKVSTFMAPKSYSTYAAWNYDASLIR